MTRPHVTTHTLHTHAPTSVGETQPDLTRTSGCSPRRRHAALVGERRVVLAQRDSGLRHDVTSSSGTSRWAGGGGDPHRAGSATSGPLQAAEAAPLLLYVATPPKREIESAGDLLSSFAWIFPKRESGVGWARFLERPTGQRLACVARKNAANESVVASWCGDSEAPVVGLARKRQREEPFFASQHMQGKIPQEKKGTGLESWRGEGRRKGANNSVRPLDPHRGSHPTHRHPFSATRAPQCA